MQSLLERVESFCTELRSGTASVVQRSAQWEQEQEAAQRRKRQSDIQDMLADMNKLLGLQVRV